VGAGCILYIGSTIGDGVFFGDQATLREDVTVGELTIIGRGATVENKVSIGSKCKIETEAYITAFSTIGDYCFIAPEVTFTNDNFLGRTEERKKHFGGPTLKRGARIGANATILPNLVIGEDALVAAGSVVTKDVPPRMVVVGSPARAVRPVPEEQLIENQIFYDKAGAPKWPFTRRSNRKPPPSAWWAWATWACPWPWKRPRPGLPSSASTFRPTRWTG
jgi:acetyltransferase-like isoleucine patch superfamily enzyme